MSRGAAASEESRDIRLMGLRLLFRSLCAAAPGAATRLAAALFRKPPRHQHSDLERRVIESGRRIDLALDGGRLAVWSWGEGPSVLLVHGWGSRGARLASFVAPLVEAGFSPVTFDAPAHGDSSGRLSSLPQFIAAIEVVTREVGCPAAIVAHSMGGAAAAVAIRRGLAPRAAVFLAPAANPGAYSERFGQMLGISPSVLDRMRGRFERQFGYSWDEFDIPRAVAGLSIPLLVFHDEGDLEVPPSDGAAIASAWRGAELVTTQGLGHRRIVHDPEIVRRGVEFLRNRAAHAVGLAS